MKILHYLKKFILFIIKEIFSFFIKLFLFLLVVLAIIGLIVQSIEEKPQVVIKDNAYVVIDLANSYKERSLSSSLFEDDSINFYNLLTNIKNLSFDDKVSGVVLKLNSNSLSYAQSEELAQELSMLRGADKKVIAYFENANRKNYYLASYADEIYMPSANSTSVNIYPYFREEFYTKKLSDKFGVKFNIIHVGDYKSYQENLAKDTMSKEAREDSTRILNLNYENFLDIVSLNRKLNRDDLDKIIKDGDLVAASSIDLFSNKLIDKYSYWDNLVTLLGGKDKLISIQDYAKNYYQEATLDDSDNIVYVIPLEGDIVEAQTEIFSGEANINVNETIAKLNTAKENKKIKAVVLRVNSPGGSALTSDIIAEKVKELASEKPVYVSMSSVAASGGYYISANANKIYVDRNTVTGSVGVVSVLVDYSSLLKDNGVNVTAVVYAPAFGFRYENVREMAAAYCKAPCSVCIETGVEWRETMAKENGISGALVNYNRSCKPWSGAMPEIERRWKEDLGIPVVHFDGDQADERNFSTEQYNTRVQGLVEIMQERKEERLANGEEVYTNFENTKETDWSKETIKH